MLMERGSESSCSEFDYSCVDNVVTKVLSYYQSAKQLKEIPWGLPGSWYLKGPTGPKRACSQCCAKNTLRASVLYLRSIIKDYRIRKD